MTLVEHARWCITQLPLTNAEMTVWWFLTGLKEWDYFIALEFEKEQP